MKNEKRFICTVAILSLIAGVTQLPIMISQFYLKYLDSIDYDADDFRYVVESASKLSLSVNFAVNPFIYLWRIPKYRRTFKTLYCKK